MPGSPSKIAQCQTTVQVSDSCSDALPLSMKASPRFLTGRHGGAVYCGRQDTSSQTISQVASPLDATLPGCCKSPAGGVYQPVITNSHVSIVGSTFTNNQAGGSQCNTNTFNSALYQYSDGGAVALMSGWPADTSGFLKVRSKGPFQSSGCTASITSSTFISNSATRMGGAVSSCTGLDTEGSNSEADDPCPPDKSDCTTENSEAKCKAVNHCLWDNGSYKNKCPTQLTPSDCNSRFECLWGSTCEDDMKQCKAQGYQEPDPSGTSYPPIWKVNGCGVCPDSVGPGCIFPVIGPAAAISIHSSTFEYNTATRAKHTYGGAICGNFSQVVNSVFKHNLASTGGGAILNYMYPYTTSEANFEGHGLTHSGSMTVSGCTFTNNSASGPAFTEAVTRNTAESTAWAELSGGGAILSSVGSINEGTFTGKIEVTNSSFNLNKATRQGGAIASTCAAGSKADGQYSVVTGSAVTCQSHTHITDTEFTSNTVSDCFSNSLPGMNHMCSGGALAVYSENNIARQLYWLEENSDTMSLIVNGSTFSSNKAFEGAALGVTTRVNGASATVDLIASTFESNSATGVTGETGSSGGALYMSGCSDLTCGQVNKGQHKERELHFSPLPWPSIPIRASHPD